MEMYKQTEVGETIEGKVFLVKRKHLQPQTEQDAQTIMTTIEIGKNLDLIKDYNEWGVVSIDRLPADVIIHNKGEASVLVHAGVYANQKSLFGSSSFL